MVAALSAATPAQARDLQAAPAGVTLETANLHAVPDWTRFDLGARYATLIGGRRTVFRANVINVANATYRTGVASYGTLFQAAPRTYKLSMSVDLPPSGRAARRSS